MSGTKKVLSLLAVIAAVSGAAIAVGKYLKNKGINLREALDYKNNIFSEDDIDIDNDNDDDFDLAQPQPLDEDGCDGENGDQEVQPEAEESESGLEPQSDKAENQSEDD